MLDKVSDRIYADLTGKTGGNFGLVVLDDQIVFIDAGMVHTYTDQVRQWAETEFERKVTKLIYTHSHSDHVFGAQGLGEVCRIGSSQMRLICEENLQSHWKRDAIIESMKSRRDERPELWNAIQNLELKLPDIVFEDGLIVGSSRDLKIVHRGGHTAGSSTVSVEPEHILFIGDLIFSGVFPYAADHSCDPDKWISVLETIVLEDYDLIIPGHGPLCDNKELEKHISFLSDLRDAVKDAISKGITKDQFSEQGLLPTHYDEGLQHRGPITIDHFYNFYG
ncbi:MAG: MBL fold metallo-hydrolase [Candidatus Thorarchaeota archaeon]